MNDTITLTGQVSIVLYDEAGNIKEERSFKNLVVTAGKDFAVARMTSGSGAVMSHMGVGAGTVAATATDTTLSAELTRVSLSSMTGVGNVLSHSANFGAGVGTGAITEAGIFNSASGGTMLARTVFAPINKLAPDTLSVSWNVTLA